MPTSGTSMHVITLHRKRGKHEQVHQGVSINANRTSANKYTWRMQTNLTGEWMPIVPFPRQKPDVGVTGFFFPVRKVSQLYIFHLWQCETMKKNPDWYTLKLRLLIRRLIIYKDEECSLAHQDNKINHGRNRPPSNESTKIFLKKAIETGCPREYSNARLCV